MRTVSVMAVPPDDFMESLKAQIAAQIRKTLEEASDVENPLSIFAPYFWDSLRS